ncbi:MAG: hypothetical protein J0L97_09455 [Alphaproteobacteria bacterium]|nr:hypothetical protein [Alphaproteobacteria bacterium]
MITSLSPRRLHALVTFAATGFSLLSFSAAAGDADVIQQRLDAARFGETVQLSAGTYVLEKGLVIRKSGVTLAGAGVDKTTLVASFPSEDGAIVRILGQSPAEVWSSKRSQLKSKTGSGTTKLILEKNLGNILPGSFVLVRMANDKAFLDSIKSKVWNEKYPHVRTALGQVDSISNTTLILKQPIGLPFQPGAEIIPLDVVRNAGVKDLTIKYDIGGAPDGMDFTNAKPNNAVDGLLVENAAWPNISNVAALWSGRHGFAFDTVYMPFVSYALNDGSWNKGKEGNGYFRISRTYYGTFQNITLRNMRHLTIQWSSYDNKVTHLNADSDINFHGGYTQRNTVQFDYLVDRDGKGGRISTTPYDASWAPPDGSGNKAIDANGKTVSQ